MAPVQHGVWQGWPKQRLVPLFLLRFSLFLHFVMAVKPLFFFPKRVNVLGQRLVSFQIFLVSLWILVFGETASKIPGESGEWCVGGVLREWHEVLFLPRVATIALVGLAGMWAGGGFPPR